MKTNGASITRDVFLAAEDRPLVPVELDPELYGPDARIYLRAMDGYERSELEKRWADKKASENPSSFRWDVLHRCLRDEQGVLLFGLDDENRIMGTKDRPGKNAGTLEQFFTLACEMNGLTKKDVEELEKNSDGSP